MFIAVYVNYNDESDRHSRLLGVFETRDEAVAAVHADMDAVARYYGDGAMVDMSAFEVWRNDTLQYVEGCAWDVLDSDNPL